MISILINAFLLYFLTKSNKKYFSHKKIFITLNLNLYMYKIKQFTKIFK